MTPPGGVDAPADDLERFLDLERADWMPGAPCPGCGHRSVHTIVRAGVLFRESESWELEEILGCTRRSVRTATGCHPSTESKSRLTIAR
jgi:hypothetical protein